MSLHHQTIPRHDDTTTDDQLNGCMFEIRFSSGVIHPETVIFLDGLPCSRCICVIPAIVYVITRTSVYKYSSFIKLCSFKSGFLIFFRSLHRRLIVGFSAGAVPHAQAVLSLVILSRHSPNHPVILPSTDVCLFTSTSMSAHRQPAQPKLTQLRCRRLQLL
jgi:hypothetical protein